MKPIIWVNGIVFNDNTEIKFNKNDIVVFVGPNNAGKSATLKECIHFIKEKNATGKILKKLTVEAEGEFDDVVEYIKSFSNFEAGYYRGYRYSLHPDIIRHGWKSQTKGIGELTSLFTNVLSTEKRIQTANPAQNIKLTTQAISHPIHFLQKDDSIEQKFNGYFRQAFNKDLIVHRNAGSEVPLYIGEKPILKEGEDRISSSYLQELEKLDLLHEQGDGMRSFVGVLLNAFIAHHSILFIDEPEAFLHPPQARLLGKMLAKDLPSQRQLFLATHSEDFVKGLLDANVENLRIVRIQRDGSINKVSSLTNSDIKEIWNDSLLRHSDILNGLFHSKVVICESDSDCRFFSAMLSAQFDNSSSIAPDILFIQCGGKHRIPVAIKALKKLNVPIVVISDFDLMNDIRPLKDIFEDLGGIWENIETDWNIVKREIEQKRPEFLTSDVKKEIEDILNTTADRIFPKDKIIKIQKILKKASPWSEAKEGGKSYIPSGNATQAFDRLQLKLKDKKILVLEVGELESFAKSIGNHGPKWVNEVLSKDLKNDAELEAARQFVRLIL